MIIMNIEENYDKIYKYIYYRIHDKELAEDLTQEVFLRFLDSSYREQGKDIRYLYTIARNLCIDAMRSSGRESRYERQDIEDCAIELPSNETPIEEQVVEAVWLKQVLNRLSEEDREIVFLRFVNEEPISVISQMYGISRFAVYRKLIRIQQQIKKELYDMEVIR